MASAFLPLLASVLLANPAPQTGATAFTPEQKRAVAAIEKVQGKVEIDRDGVKVTLRNAYVEDHDLAHLKAFPDLHTLDLNFAQQITDAGLEHVKGLTGLRSLGLIYTKVRDDGLKHLQGLTELRNLDLPGVSGAGLEHLKGLTRLESLQLGNTRVADEHLAHLKGLKNLRSLDFRGLRWHPPITDAGLEHLKQLPKLERLVLTGKITDAGLEQLKGMSSLRSLDLLSTHVTDAGLAHLRGLTDLESLYVPGGVSDEGLKHLKSLTGLRELKGLDKNVTDAGLAHLKGLPRLRGLHLWYAGITPEGLAQLPGLESIHAGHVPLKDDGLKLITQRLPGLRELHFHACPVTDAGLEYLKGLKKLESLGLYDTEVTAEGVKALRQTFPTLKIDYHR